MVGGGRHVIGVMGGGDLIRLLLRRDLARSRLCFSNISFTLLREESGPLTDIRAGLGDSAVKSENSPAKSSARLDFRDRMAAVLQGQR
jgi:hypothetical protein